MNNKMVHMAAFILLILGGIHLLLVGLLDLDLIVSVLGVSLSKIVFVLIGVAAVYEIFVHKKSCSVCSVGKSSTPMTTPPAQ